MDRLLHFYKHAYLVKCQKKKIGPIIESTHVFKSELEQVYVVDQDLVSDLGSAKLPLLVQNQLERLLALDVDRLEPLCLDERQPPILDFLLRHSFIDLLQNGLIHPAGLVVL